MKITFVEPKNLRSSVCSVALLLFPRPLVSTRRGVRKNLLGAGDPDGAARRAALPAAGRPRARKPPGGARGAAAQPRRGRRRVLPTARKARPVRPRERHHNFRSTFAIQKFLRSFPRNASPGESRRGGEGPRARSRLPSEVRAAGACWNLQPSTPSGKQRGDPAAKPDRIAGRYAHGCRLSTEIMR